MASFVPVYVDAEALNLNSSLSINYFLLKESSLFLFLKKSFVLKGSCNDVMVLSVSLCGTTYVLTGSYYKYLLCVLHLDILICLKHSVML